MKLEPGSVVLTPAEVARLRKLSDAWGPATEQSLSASLEILLALANEVRDLLAGAEMDERKPMVR